MSQRLRLPTGRLVRFRKKLDRQLQNLRKRVSTRRITKGQAKDWGARILRAHREELVAFVRAYLKRKKVLLKFNNDDFRTDTREAIVSWNKIVSDM